jgi:hypothetical protein
MRRYSAGEKSRHIAEADPVTLDQHAEKSLSNATTNKEAKRKFAGNGTACGLERRISG